MRKKAYEKKEARGGTEEGKGEGRKAIKG